jgi:VanZ family protein
MRKDLLGKASLVAFCLGVLAVVWLSLAPGDPLGSNQWDKLGHLFAYAALAVCGTQAFARGHARLTSYLGLLALGCVLEGVQAYVPGRHPSIADGTANAVGIMVGVLLSWIGARALVSMKVWLR